MNRKRSRKKSKRKYTKKYSNKNKHTMNRKLIRKSKSKRNRYKHKKGGAGFVKTLVKKPFQAAQRGLKSMERGSIDVEIPDDLNMKCGHCNHKNFKIYTIYAYGKFLYCDGCGAVCGFAGKF